MCASLVAIVDSQFPQSYDFYVSQSLSSDVEVHRKQDVNAWRHVRATSLGRSETSGYRTTVAEERRQEFVMH